MWILQGDNSGRRTPYETLETIRAQPTHITCTDTGNSSNRFLLRFHFECSSDFAKCKLDVLDCRAGRKYKVFDPETSNTKTFFREPIVRKRVMPPTKVCLKFRRNDPLFPPTPIKDCPIPPNFRGSDWSN